MATTLFEAAKSALGFKSIKTTKGFGSNADMHSKGQDSPLTKLINTVEGKFKFGMEIPDTMINDAIKQSTRYKYYKHKKNESNQEVNVPSMFKKNVVPRKQRSITIANNLVPQEDVAVELAKSKPKGPAIEDPVVQSLLDLRRGSKESRFKSVRQEKKPVGGEGSSAVHDKYYEFKDISATYSDATRDSSCSETDKEKDDETDDFEDSDMDLSDDEPKGDDDVIGFGVFMYNKSTEPLKSTYLSPIVTFYTDAHTTSAVANPKGNPEVTSYISGASEVPFGTNVDVQATNLVLKEMFLVKKLMDKAKNNLRKITFRKAVAQKFKEYDQNMEALSSIKVSEEIEEAVQAKVLTKMKKQLPTYVPNVIAKYVKPRLNNFVHEVMRNNQISLFTTQSPTIIDDLSEIELKLKLLNRMHLNKSYETHNTPQKLYDTLYASITLDQKALDAQDAEPSFHKRTHDDQDPPNGLEGEKRKKRIKDTGEPSSRSSRKDKSPMDGLQRSRGDVSKPRSFERHMSKSTKPYSSFYNNDFYYLVNLSMGEKWSKKIHRYQIKALNGIHHWEDGRKDFFEAEIYNKSPYKVYSDKRIISVIRVDVKRKWGYRFLSLIVVRRLDKKEYEFSYANLPRLSLNDIEDMYLLKVQDKLHHLKLDFKKDFNNALLLFIRRTMIQQRTEKGVMYLNQHNIKSLMKLDEVHKFYNGTLLKIHDNLIDMVNKNELGRRNQRLKGKDWGTKDIKRSNEMLDKID
ncbi:hypothetical protein Tco_0739523 [Tanacetum coccineum]